jgi:hypothetical protein
MAVLRDDDYRSDRQRELSMLMAVTMAAAALMDVRLELSLSPRATVSSVTYILSR